jgi:hypothetical protein
MQPPQPASLVPRRQRRRTAPRHTCRIRPCAGHPPPRAVALARPPRRRHTTPVQAHHLQLRRLLRGRDAGAAPDATAV